MCRSRSRVSDTPASLAASTCGRAAIALTSPRTMREYHGHQKIEIAIAVLSRLGPSAATTAIAISVDGSTRNRSVKREMTRSVQPP